jgi:hypothetical protein
MDSSSFLGHPVYVLLPGSGTLGTDDYLKKKNDM